MIVQLRTRVGIYYAQSVPDEMGGAVASWPLWGSVWADIRLREPHSSFENGRRVVTRHYRVIIRHRDNFPERARLMWEGRTLSVTAASDPDMRRERLHLICEEELQ